MSDAFDRASFQAQELVFSRCDPGDCAYVIESGCVEVLAGSAEAPQRLALLSEGAMFGEVALLDRQPRTASVRTLVPTRLIRIDRAHVEEMLLRSDPVIQYLLRLLLSRFRSTKDAGGALYRTLTAVSAQQELDLHKAAVRTLTLAKDLSDAIERTQLELFYQPLIAMQGLALVGFEALVRWNHPTLGLINPDEFIPLAERTGLIHRIGQWVLQRALTEWGELRTLCDGAPHAFISINLSAPELANAQTVDGIEAGLRHYGIRPSELRIELTETSIIRNMEAVSRALHRLRALGVGIALDDFGTGYAGLDYVQTLPFSCLKIDKTFVQQMQESERSAHIVKAALELASSIGMSTIAEGIESAAVAARLSAMGCTYAQGFHYARPLPRQALAPWLATHTALYQTSPSNASTSTASPG